MNHGFYNEALDKLKEDLADGAVQQIKRLNITSNASAVLGNSAFNDDNLDAFRHAFGAAKIVLTYRKKIAGIDLAMEVVVGVNSSLFLKPGVIIMGLEYELRNLSNSSASVMDHHNNAVGADIGADLSIFSNDDDIGDAVYQAMLRGELVVNLDDKRDGFFDYEGFFEKALERASNQPRI